MCFKITKPTGLARQNLNTIDFTIHSGAFLTRNTYAQWPIDLVYCTVKLAYHAEGAYS